MNKIEVNYTIPTTKKDITLSQWMKFETIINEDDMDNDFIQKKMMEIFCGIPLQYAYQLPHTDVEEILGYLNKTFESESVFTSKFTHENVEYGFVPNFKKCITSEELFDLESYLEHKEYSKLLSILYRPITNKMGDTYTIEPYDGTHNKFDNLPYEIFESSIGFFLTLLKQLAVATLKYTQKLMKDMKKSNSDSIEKVNSLLNGVDIQSLSTYMPLHFIANPMKYIS